MSVYITFAKLREYIIQWYFVIVRKDMDFIMNSKDKSFVMVRKGKGDKIISKSDFLKNVKDTLAKIPASSRNINELWCVALEACQFMCRDIAILIYERCKEMEMEMEMEATAKAKAKAKAKKEGNSRI